MRFVLILKPVFLALKLLAADRSRSEETNGNEKDKMNSLLQDHVRKLLHRIEELEKNQLDQKVHGQSRQRLENVKAGYRHLINVSFDDVEWEDPG